ncbi:hypothetical protein ACQJBY_016511 [Aegilops geniculata]
MAVCLAPGDAVPGSSSVRLGSVGGADGRRKVHGLNDVVAPSTVSWQPVHGEAKLLHVLYLWHPNTRGVGHLYDGFLRLLVARPAKDVAAVAVGQMWLVEATPCVSPQLHTARSGRAGAAY